MQKIKKYLKENLGEKFKITVDVDRKKCSSITCLLKEVYPSIFVVEVMDNESEKLRTFTYSDIYSKQIYIEKLENN